MFLSRTKTSGLGVGCVPEPVWRGRSREKRRPSLERSLNNMAAQVSVSKVSCSKNLPSTGDFQSQR